MQDNLKATIIIQKYLINFIKENFRNNRIICLLAYGSSICYSPKMKPKDYDFLLLLDKYNKSDYKILKRITNKYHIELFIDYWDYIKRKGFDSYQRGRHGSYFVPYLALAKCLIGENIYQQSVKIIPIKTIKKDLLYRIEEYFYRIQKLYIYKDKDASNVTKKYISRICIDLLLYANEMSFEEIYTIHYEEVIHKKVMHSNIFDQNIKAQLSKLFLRMNTNLLLETIGSLYEVYLKCFEDYRKTYLLK